MRKRSVFGKQKLALAKAKFRAWWEGAPFDEQAAGARLETDDGADDGALEDALFEDEDDSAPSPRLVALAHLWGQGRIRPGDDAADALEPARLGAPDDGSVAVLGCGLSAPLIAFARSYPGSIACFEWREETLELLRRGVKRAKLDARISVSRIDLDAYAFQHETFDAIWSVDDFVYVGHPPHLAHQFARALRPGGCVMVESYMGQSSPLHKTAFASSFAEPQVRTHEQVLEYFNDFGLTVESDENISEDFIVMAREGFKRLGASLTQAAALDVHAAQELAWEAEAWRTRLRLLSTGVLQRRRIILRKPLFALEEPVSAPAIKLAPTPIDDAAEEALVMDQALTDDDVAALAQAYINNTSENADEDAQSTEESGNQAALVLRRLLVEKARAEAKAKAKAARSEAEQAE